MNDSLAAIILIIKNLCFNVVAVLTALVILGNELRRWKLTFRWLEERQAFVRRAWHVSLGVFLALSALYAGLVHQPAPLVIDSLTIGVMVGAVYLLQHRRGGRPPLKAVDEDDEDDSFLKRRSPRRERTVPVPPDADEPDDDAPPPRTRRERRVRR